MIRILVSLVLLATPIMAQTFSASDVLKVQVNGNHYEGDYLNGKRNGYGTFIYTSGDRHEFDWRDDKEHGSWCFTYANGERIDRFWRKGKRQ